MTSATDTQGWIAIDADAQLCSPADAICWDDSEALAFVAGSVIDRDFCPRDLSRSGHRDWNARVMFSIDHPRHRHLELLLIDCDEFSVEVDGWLA